MSENKLPEIKGIDLDKLNPHEYGGLCSRKSVVIQRADPQSNEDGYPTIATTSNPTLIMDWSRLEVVREVLPMQYVEMPDNDKTPVLDTHDWDSIEDILGSARNWSVSDTKLNCRIYPSIAEVEVKQKIDDGTIYSVSLGYQTDKRRTIEVPKGAAVTIDSIIFTNNYTDDIPFLVRTWWKPMEVSLLAFGANDQSKIQRGIHRRIKAEDPELQRKLDEAFEKIEAQSEEIKNLRSQITAIKTKTKEAVMADEPKKEGKSLDQIRKEERERVQDIENIASRFANNYIGNIEEAKRGAIQNNQTANMFLRHVFDNYDESKPIDKPATEIGLSERELNTFSISKAILAQSEHLRGNANAWKNAGFEREVLEEADKKANQIQGLERHGGLTLPYEYITQRMIPDQQKRATPLSTGTAADGGYLVGTQHMPELIPLLRNKTVAGQLGVKIISGLSQNIDIPKQLAAGTFAWGAENFDSSQSQMTFGQVTASPKEGKSSTTYGRRLLLQSNPSIDMAVNDDLLAIAKIGLDDAVINGAGGIAPAGVLNTTGIGSIDGTLLDWAGIVSFETGVATNNADINPLKFLMNPTVRGLLKTRIKDTNGYNGYLMDKDGTVNGYPGLVSNQSPTSTLAFGDWSRVWLCDWSLYELLVNPYKDESGNVTVTIFVYADVVTSIASALNASVNIT